jgi:HK97 family phage portal protein
VRGRLGGPPQELWWLRAPDLEAHLGRVWIDSYTYKSRNNPPEDYLARDVIAWRSVNLQDPTKGLSPLSAARYSISQSRQHDVSAAALLDNWSVPPGAWVIPKDADFSPQDRSLVQRALRALRGPRGRGKVPVLPQGLTWQTIALTPQDQETLGARKLSRMQICAVEGVPLVLAGDDEKTTVYANMRDAERIFARYMISELDGLADGYNGWLVPDFDPAPPGRRRIVIAFDYSEIEALQAPLEERKRVALAEIQHGARTGDEYRAEFRTGEPLPNDEGKVVTRLSTLIPIGEGPDAPPANITATPTGLPPDGSSDTIRHFYRQPAVRAWFAGSSDLDSVAALLGVAASDDLAVGLRRRYTPAQLLDGMPVEGYSGLRTRTAA